MLWAESCPQFSVPAKAWASLRELQAQKVSQQTILQDLIPSECPLEFAQLKADRKFLKEIFKFLKSVVIIVKSKQKDKAKEEWTLENKQRL